MFHLVKIRKSERIDQSGCYLALNGNQLSIRAHIDPADSYADIGSYGVSNSAFLTLNSGDTVRLEACVGGSNPASTLDSQSSFSGLRVTSFD